MQRSRLAGRNDLRAIAAGDLFSAGLRSDGVLVEWGRTLGSAPLLSPGQRWLDLAAGGSRAAALVDTGYRIFGPGCPGSTGQARLVPIALPQLGRAARLEIGPLPMNIAVLATGGDNTSSPFGPLPLDGTPFGMPGCFLRARPDLVTVLSGTGGWGTFSFSLPNAPFLTGLPVYQQALGGDPGVNPVGIVISHAGASVIVQ